MSERNPKRFEEGSNAQQRSAEEQQRLMEEYSQTGYDEVFPENDEAEKAYNETMAAREHEANAAIEERIMGNDRARYMYMVAQQVAELRANGGEAKIISDKEDKLQELLEAYADRAQADRDKALTSAEITGRDTIKGREIRLSQEIEAEEESAKRFEEIDFIINSTDDAWVREKAEKPSTQASDPTSSTESTEKLDTAPGPEPTDAGDEKTTKEEADPLEELKKKELPDPIELPGHEDDTEDPLKTLDGTKAPDPIVTGDEKTTKEEADPLEELKKKELPDPIELPGHEDDTTEKSWLQRQKEKLWSKETENGDDLPFLRRQYKKVYNLFYNRREKGTSTEEKDRKERRTVFAVAAVGGLAFIGALVAQKYGILPGGFGGGHADPNTLPHGTGGAFPPETPPNTGGSAPHEVFSEAAHTVHRGEGWDEVMEAAGVHKDLWHDRLTEVGPRLVEKGLAYWDNAHSEYRISAPGQLSQDVLELLKNGQ